jgi:hypothetical protein
MCIKSVKMPRANNFGSLGNTYKHGNGAQKIAKELRNRDPKNFVVSDVAFVNDKFVFSIQGKRLMTVTANGGIKKKIAQKICKPITAPENPGAI